MSGEGGGVVEIGHEVELVERLMGREWLRLKSKKQGGRVV